MWLNKAKDTWHDLPRLARWVVPVLFGLIASLGQAPFGLPLVSLIAFAASFGLLAIAKTPKQAARLGWFFGLGYFALTLQWLVSPFFVEPERYGWMAPFAVFLMAGGLSVFWGAAFGAARWLGSYALILTLPLAELARAYVFTGFPWGMPAYGLVDVWLGQGAAIVGPHGLNIVVLAVSFALFRCVTSTGRIRTSFAAVSVLGLMLMWPFPHGAGDPETLGTLRLVQPNAPQHQKWDPDYMPVFFERALEATAAEGQPDLIVWPETSLPAALPGGETELARLAEAANGTPVVFGSNRYEIVRLFNSAVLMDENGELTQTYDKHHLVPFGEYMPLGELMARFGFYGLAASEGRGFSEGQGAVLMDLGPLGKALPLICYEAVFPQDVGAYAERPDFLLQITNDAWFGTFSGPHQHLAQSRMRAIEQGLPMARAANTGISGLIDSKGRVLAALPLNETGFIDVPLPRRGPATLYSKTRDWPVFLVLFCALLIVYAKKRRDIV